MSFEDALKRLAEKWPEKFNFNADPLLRISDGIHQRHIAPAKITQDDLDEILALIGWEYEIHRTLDGWFEYHHRVYTDGRLGANVGHFQLAAFAHPTKLEAAKAALIAVVEKEVQ